MIRIALISPAISDLRAVTSGETATCGRAINHIFVPRMSFPELVLHLCSIAAFWATNKKTKFPELLLSARC